MVERWAEARHNAHVKIAAMDDCPDDALDALLDPVDEMEHEMFLTPAKSVRGVLVKLGQFFREYDNWITCDINEEPSEEMPTSQAAVLCVLRDLKRLVR